MRKLIGEPYKRKKQPMCAEEGCTLKGTEKRKAWVKETKRYIYLDFCPNHADMWDDTRLALAFGKQEGKETRDEA